MTPAVNPHRMTSLSSPIRNPGPTQPEGWRTVIRCVGSSSSLDRHPVDRVHLVGVDHVDLAGVVPPAQDRRDREVARRQPQLGQLGEDLDPGGSRPVSSTPRAARLAGVSPASIEPPGNDTWPGWERMWWARSVSSRSGPSPGPRRTASARRRAAGLGVLGRHEAGQVVDGDRPRAAASTGAQPVRPGVAAHSATPRCSLDQGSTAPARSRPAELLVDDRPSASTSAKNGKPFSTGNGSGAPERACGSASSG